MRLLPDDPEIGWTPYLWLVYLLMFFAYLVLGRAGALEWSLSLLAVLVFLVLYFRGYWAPRGAEAWAIVAAITGIGVLFLPVNPGASVFFVYAAAFLGYMTTPRRALGGLAAIAAIAGLEAWLLDVPVYGWLPAIGVSLLIGLANVHFGEVSRKNLALRRAREEVEQLAKLAERERIARDLHDLLGHTLSTIALKAELAAKLTERQPARAGGEIAEVAAIARRTLAEVRKAVSGFRAVGLGEALAGARQALLAGEVTLEEAIAPGELPSQTEGVLALALREAVTNVLRHAGARRCAVRLGRDHEAVWLEVADDGRGGQAREGEGLRGMRERVEALGGRVERSAEAGTRLRVVLPLPGDEPRLAGGAPA
jgi:two-component system sensor histidine kinase DesK